MKKTLKLVPRRFPMLKKGKKIGWQTVGETVIGGWDRMTDALKKLFRRQYDYDWKNLDLIYNHMTELLIAEKYGDITDDVRKSAEAHKTRMLDLFNIIEYKKAENAGTINDDLKRLYGDTILRESKDIALPDTYLSNLYKNRYIREYSTPRFNAEEDWKNYATKPLLELERVSIPSRNFIHLIWSQNNKELYRKKVRRPNNKYYNLLIQRVNKEYGTLFRDMYDIAAFLDFFGAKLIDGIIGPETEAMLDHYFKRNANESESEYKPINTRRMYKKQDNKSVYDNTKKAYK